MGSRRKVVRKVARKTVRREKKSEKAASRKGPQVSMCCSFIGTFAHVQGVFAYVQLVPYVLPA